MALKDKRVSALTVVEYLEDVIRWHKEELVPMGSVLNEDQRCRFVHGDFFALSKDTKGSFNPENPSKKYDVILLDIDHSPSQVLDPKNSFLYTEEGLRALASHLKPKGVFALWADGVADDSFAEKLKEVYSTVSAHTIEFNNPIHGGVSTGAVYVSTVE